MEAQVSANLFRFKVRPLLLLLSFQFVVLMPFSFKHILHILANLGFRVSIHWLTYFLKFSVHVSFQWKEKIAMRNWFLFDIRNNS